MPGYSLPWWARAFPNEFGVLVNYMGSNMMDWKRRLSSAWALRPEELPAPLLLLQKRMGKRLFSDTPIFESGDGVTIDEGGELWPGTVTSVTDGIVSVRADHIIISGSGSKLYIPRDEGLVHEFTARKSGEFFLKGTRSLAAPRLLFGRSKA